MMAAATLLVLFAFTRLLKVSDSLSGDELFDEYFALPEVSAVRSGYLTDDQWSTDLAYLQSGNYSFALALLVPFQQDESVVRREEALLYSGICHIQLDQYREAIESFASISIDSSLAKEGQWYTALAYLKLGSKEETKRILKSIISSTWHPKMKETETLLKKL
jgi:tetratricopeptide (TPR) repeat protein